MEVEGWLNPLDAQIIFELGSIQTNAGISGAVGEIGVHHGKLAILLYLMLHREEKGFCIDVFDQQELNIDRSGKGNENIFMNNLGKFGIDKNLVHVIKNSSANINSKDIKNYVGEVRIFSVDGSHTAEFTYNDLVLSETSLSLRGVIVLDDLFNADWPGVSEGCHKYLFERRDKMVVFAISENKTFICNEEDYLFYFSHFENIFKDQIKKTV